MSASEEFEDVSIERRFIYWIFFVIAQFIFSFFTFALTIAPIDHRARLLPIGIMLIALAILLIVGLWSPKEGTNIWMITGMPLEKAASVLLGAETVFCLSGILELTWLILTGKPG